jgi:geranylgeranyl diphosphate synthase type II
MATTEQLAFQDVAAEYKQQVDQQLDQLTRYPAGSPAVLTEAIRHSLLSAGKRLRPILVLMAARACGQQQEAVLEAACAVEMIHTYSLIHDDLPAMDDDDLRRGLPTCHAVYGEANAILAGDALLAQAFEVISAMPAPAEVVVRCSQELAAAAGGCQLVGGQVDDLAAEQGLRTLEQLESIHRRKTGAMFRVALRLGGIIARASDEQITALDTYGDRMGLAFQVTDDLLDHAGDEQQVGKRTGKDLDRGKLTYPGLLGIDQSRLRAADLIQQACQAIECLAPLHQPLVGLAQFVLERDR